MGQSKLSAASKKKLDEVPDISNRSLTIDEVTDWLDKLIEIIEEDDEGST